MGFSGREADSKTGLDPGICPGVGAMDFNSFGAPVAAQRQARHGQGMRLKDYLIGVPVDLYSPLTPEEVAQRVNQRSKSTLNPFAIGVIGWARFGRLRLQHHQSIFRYNAAPLLIARIENASGRTRISGKFGGSMFAKIGLSFWYLVLCLMFAAWVSVFLGSQSTDSGELSFFVVIPILAAMPLGMHYLFTWHWEEDLKAILAFLETEVQAKPT